MTSKARAPSPDDDVLDLGDDFDPLNPKATRAAAKAYKAAIEPKKAAAAKSKKKSTAANQRAADLSMDEESEVDVHKAQQIVREQYAAINAAQRAEAAEARAAAAKAAPKPKAKKAAAPKDDGDSSPPRKASGGSSKRPKAYVPKLKSAPYAFLVALYNACGEDIDNWSKVTIAKTDLAVVAQPFTSTDILAEKGGGAGIGGRSK